MKFPDRKANHASIFLVIIYTVGLIGMSTERFEPLFKLLTPGNLLLTMFVLFYFHSPFTFKHAILALSVIIIGFLAEVVGVNTGILFGDYWYGETLGWKIWNTPLIIGVNWLVLSYCAWLIVSEKLKQPVIKILVASVLMVLFDVAMEPVAIRYDMWTWDGGNVPIHNYIGWFGVSVIIFSLYHFASLPMRNPLKYTIFIIQWLFFIALYILNIL